MSSATGLALAQMLHVGGQILSDSLFFDPRDGWKPMIPETPREIHGSDGDAQTRRKPPQEKHAEATAETAES